MILERALKQAGRALQTAQLTFGDGDYDGACNRAYFAMFYATRAALIAAGQPEAAMGKTHSGMIASLGKHLALPGHLPADLSSSLGRESKRRMVIDYQGDGATMGEATEAIGTATAFVTAIRDFLTSREGTN